MNVIHGQLSAGVFAAATGVSFLLTPFVARLAKVLGIVDLPNARKVHREPTPRCGGIAIAVATLVAALPLLLLRSELLLPHTQHCFLVLIAISAGLWLLGLCDDLYNIPARYKLLTLLAAAGAFCAFCGRVETVWIFGFKVIQPGVPSWLFTMAWLGGVTVAMNFIDGLDGLAAGLAAIASGVLAIAAASTGQVGVMLIALALSGSLLGFLVFNFSPARIFMGDCGSMFIGFVLAGDAVLFSSKDKPGLGVLLPALALLIPLFDTMLTFVRRGIRQRRSIFSAERGHIHHRLLDLGFGTRQAVVLIYGVSLLGALAGLICFYAGAWVGFAAAAIAVIIVLFFFRAAGSTAARETFAAILRNRVVSKEAGGIRRAFEDAQLRFARARGFDEWWQNVCDAAESFEFISVSLPLQNRNGSSRIQFWHRDIADVPSDLVRAILPLRHRRSGESLELTLQVAVGSGLESAGGRIARFSRLMEEHSLTDLPVETAAQSARAQLGDIMAAAAEINGVEISGPTRLLKVAIVHDFLYTYAGAERVLEQLLLIYPQAQIFSLFDFLPDDQRGFIGDRPVTTSFLQRLPFARRHHRMFLPLMPIAIEQLDVSDFDLVISSSYCAAKGVLTSPRQLHVCYCHTPVRYAWDLQQQYLNVASAKNRLQSLFARAVFHYIRNWDVRSANGVDVFCTNSRFVGQRVQKIYRRSSVTVYPPVDTTMFTECSKKSDFYLTASRLVPYKRVDLIVEAFARTPDKRLVVIGEGPDLARLQGMAGPNVRILGRQSAESLRSYMQLARGFIFAAEEDFGIVPVEAQACGTPVLAFGRGGALESVLPGTTGIFFKEQTVASLLDALVEFDQMEWDSGVIRKHAERFSNARFRQQFLRLADEEWVKFQSRHAEEKTRGTEGDDETASHPVDGQRAAALLPDQADMQGVVAQ